MIKNNNKKCFKEPVTFRGDGIRQKVKITQLNSK